MNVKSEKGITGVDIVIGLIVFVMGTVAIMNLYIQIYKIIAEEKIHETIIGYITVMSEEIDLQNYEDQADVDRIIATANIPDGYTVEADITKYSDQVKASTGETVEDLVETINFKIKYLFDGKERSFEMRKVKVKE